MVITGIEKNKAKKRYKSTGFTVVTVCTSLYKQGARGRLAEMTTWGREEQVVPCRGAPEDPDLRREQSWSTAGTARTQGDQKGEKKQKMSKGSNCVCAPVRESAREKTACDGVGGAGRTVQDFRPSDRPFLWARQENLGGFEQGSDVISITFSNAHSSCCGKNTPLDSQRVYYIMFSVFMFLAPPAEGHEPVEGAKAYCLYSLSNQSNNRDGLSTQQTQDAYVLITFEGSPAFPLWHMNQQTMFSEEEERTEPYTTCEGAPLGPGVKGINRSEDWTRYKESSWFELSIFGKPFTILSQFPYLQGCYVVQMNFSERKGQNHGPLVPPDGLSLSLLDDMGFYW